VSERPTPTPVSTLHYAGAQTARRGRGPAFAAVLLIAGGIVSAVASIWMARIVVTEGLSGSRTPIAVGVLWLGGLLLAHGGLALIIIAWMRKRGGRLAWVALALLAVYYTTGALAPRMFASLSRP
jgi:hypothetical protein